MSMERLPRGFGGVIKLKGNRRNPYLVRIQTGVVVDEQTEKARPSYKVIGYAKSRKDGILMLERYHADPYDFEGSNLTFSDVYQKTCEEFLVGKSKSTYFAYEAAYKTCEELHHLVFREIKVVHLQKMIDSCGKNYPTLRKIKVMLKMMYKYAMKYDICSKDYSSLVDILKHKNKNNNAVERYPFKKEHIDLIWSLSSDRWYQVILMLIYSGVRISELLELKKENVNLDEQWFDVVKSKTNNGIRRVPIADCTLPFFKEWYEYSTSETLLCTPEKNPFRYRNYYDSYWRAILEPINLEEYTPHFTRHTCISLLAEAKVEPTTIKKIVGHSGAMTLTERVYTHLDIGILIEAVNKMYLPKSMRKLKKT